MPFVYGTSIEENVDDRVKQVVGFYRQGQQFYYAKNYRSSVNIYLQAWRLLQQIQCDSYTAGLPIFDTLEFDLQTALADTYTSLRQHADALYHFAQAINRTSDLTPVSIRKKLFFDAGKIAQDAFGISEDQSILPSTVLSESTSNSLKPFDKSLASSIQNYSTAKQPLLRFARLCYETALGLQPGDGETLARLIKVCLELGDFATAFEVSQQIIDCQVAKGVAPPPKIMFLTSRLEEDWGTKCLKKFHTLVPSFPYKSEKECGNNSIETTNEQYVQFLSASHEAPFNESNSKRGQRLLTEEVEAERLNVRITAVLLEEDKKNSFKTVEGLVDRAIADNSIPILPILKQITEISSDPVDILFVIQCLVQTTIARQSCSNNKETSLSKAYSMRLQETEREKWEWDAIIQQIFSVKPIFPSRLSGSPSVRNLLCDELPKTKTHGPTGNLEPDDEERSSSGLVRSPKFRRRAEPPGPLSRSSPRYAVYDAVAPLLAPFIDSSEDPPPLNIRTVFDRLRQSVKTFQKPGTVTTRKKLVMKPIPTEKRLDPEIFRSLHEVLLETSSKPLQSLHNLIWKVVRTIFLTPKAPMPCRRVASLLATHLFEFYRITDYHNQVELYEEVLRIIEIALHDLSSEKDAECAKSELQMIGAGLKLIDSSTILSNSGLFFSAVALSTRFLLNSLSTHASSSISHSSSSKLTVLSGAARLLNAAIGSSCVSTVQELDSTQAEPNSESPTFPDDKTKKFISPLLATELKDLREEVEREIDDLSIDCECSILYDKELNSSAETEIAELVRKIELIVEQYTGSIKLNTSSEKVQPKKLHDSIAKWKRDAENLESISDRFLQRYLAVTQERPNVENKEVLQMRQAVSVVPYFSDRRLQFETKTFMMKTHNLFQKPPLYSYVDERFRLTGDETGILDSLLSTVGNILALNSRPCGMKPKPDFVSSRSKMRQRSSPPAESSASEIASRMEGFLECGWPSPSSPTILLASLSVLLSSVQCAERAYLPQHCCIEAIRSISYYLPRRDAKDEKSISPFRIDSKTSTAKSAIGNKRYPIPLTQSNSPIDIYSDVESLPESVGEPEEEQDGSPCAVLSFHDSAQRLLLGLFGFILSEASAASSIDLDQMKKSVQEDAHQDQTNHETLTKHLMLLMSRLRFALQCCAQLLVAPIYQPPLKSLGTFLDEYEISSRKKFEEFWPTGPFCSIILKSETSNNCEAEKAKLLLSSRNLTFIISFVDNFLLFCRGVLALELTSMRPLQLLQDTTTNIPPYLAQNTIKGIDSLFITNDLFDIPSWVSVRFHESSVVNDVLPISQSILRILPGLSTTSIPHVLLNVALSIGGIPITSRWLEKTEELMEFLWKSISESKLIALEEEIGNSGVETFSFNLIKLLKFIPKVVSDSMIDGLSLKQQSYDFKISNFFGGWQLNWYVEISLCEVLGVAATRLFGLPIYCRSGPPFSCAPIFSTTDSEALLVALTDSIERPRRLEYKDQCGFMMVTRTEQTPSKDMSHISVLKNREEMTDNIEKESEKTTARFQYSSLPSLLLMLKLHLKLASWEQPSSIRKRALVTKAFRSALSEAVEITTFLDPTVEDEGAFGFNQMNFNQFLNEKLQYRQQLQTGTSTTAKLLDQRPSRSEENSLRLAYKFSGSTAQSSCWRVNSYGLWTYISDPLTLPPMTEKIDHEEEELHEPNISSEEPPIQDINKTLSSIVAHNYPLLLTYGQTTQEKLLKSRSRCQATLDGPHRLNCVLQGQFITDDDSELVLWSKVEAQLENNENKLDFEVKKSEQIEKYEAMVDGVVSNKEAIVEETHRHRIMSTYQTSILFKPFERDSVEYLWRPISDFESYKIAAAGVLNELYHLICAPNLADSSFQIINYWCDQLLRKVVLKRPAIFCPQSLQRLCHYDLIWGDRLGMHIKERTALSQDSSNRQLLSAFPTLCSQLDTEETTLTATTPMAPSFPTVLSTQYMTYSTAYLQAEDFVNNLANINRSIALGLNGFVPISAAAFCHRQLFFLLEDRAATESPWNCSPILMHTDITLDRSSPRQSEMLDSLHPSKISEGNIQQKRSDTKLIELPVRTGVQALVLLGMESSLLSFVLKKKIQICKEEISSTVDNEDLASEHIDIQMDRTSSMEQPEVQSNSNYSLDESPNSSHSVLLRGSPFGCCNIIECLMLYLRSQVESLLVHYALVETLSPLSLGASLVTLLNSTSGDFSLYNWEITSASEEALRLHYLRLHICYESSQTLGKEVINLSNNIIHILLKKCPAMEESLLNRKSNGIELPGNSSLLLLSGCTSLTIKKLYILWNLLSLSSAPHFKGSVWIPSLIASDCISMRREADAWRIWNKNSPPQQVTEEMEHERKAILSHCSQESSNIPASSSELTEIHSSFGLRPSICSNDTPLDTEKSNTCATIIPDTELSTPINYIPNNDANLKIGCKIRSHEKFSDNEASNTTTLGSVKQPLTSPDIELLDYVLCGFKRLLHLSESITLAVTTTLAEPKQESTKLSFGLIQEDFSLYPSLGERLTLLSNTSVIVQSVSKMEEARLEILMTSERHQSKNSLIKPDSLYFLDMNASDFVDYVLSQLWMIPALFMWNGNPCTGLVELCQDYEDQRNLLFTTTKDVFLSLPWDLQPNLNDIGKPRLLIVSFLKELLQRVSLTIQDVQNDCLNAANTIVEKCGSKSSQLALLLAQYQLFHGKYNIVLSILQPFITKGVFKLPQFDEKTVGSPGGTVLASALYHQSIEMRIRSRELQRMRIALLLVKLLEFEIIRLTEESVKPTEIFEDNEVGKHTTVTATMTPISNSIEHGKEIGKCDSDLKQDSSLFHSGYDILTNSSPLPNNAMYTETSPLLDAISEVQLPLETSTIAAQVVDPPLLTSEVLVVTQEETVVQKSEVDSNISMQPVDLCISTLSSPIEPIPQDHLSAVDTKQPPLKFPQIIDLPPGVSCEILQFFCGDLNQIPRAQQKWKAVGPVQLPSLNLLSRIVEILIECLQTHSRWIKKGTPSSQYDGLRVAPSFVMLHRVTRLISVALHSATLSLSRCATPVLPWSLVKRSVDSSSIENNLGSTAIIRKNLIDIRLFRQLVGLQSITGLPTTDDAKRELSGALSTLAGALFIPELSELLSTTNVMLTPEALPVNDSQNSNWSTSSVLMDGQCKNLIVEEPSLVTDISHSFSTMPINVLAKVNSPMMDCDQSAIVAFRLEFVTKSTVKVIGLHPTIHTAMNASLLKTLLRAAPKETDGTIRKEKPGRMVEARRKRPTLVDADHVRKKHRKYVESVG